MTKRLGLTQRHAKTNGGLLGKAAQQLETLRTENDALRAEVAALHEEVEAAYLAENSAKVNATVAEAREAHARALLAEVAQHHQGQKSEIGRKLRAFLDPRRDEARRCTCGWTPNFAFPVEEYGHAPSCPMRDEARGAPEDDWGNNLDALIRKCEREKIPHTVYTRAAPTEPAPKRRK